MNALQIKNGVLAVLAAIGSYIANALGGWDAALKVLLAFMAADYLTGVLVAGIWKRSAKSTSGALNSRAGFKGLVKKCMIILLVFLGELLDKEMGTDYVRMAVILFFTGNEGLSLLENLGLMGVPFPTFLKQALEVLREQGDKGAGTPDGSGVNGPSAET